MSPPPPEDERPISTTPSRATGALAVGMSIAVWWPAFTLGAWGVLFFEQILTVWAAATAALLVVLFRRRAEGNRLGRAAALLVPTLWLVLAVLFKRESFLVPFIDALGVTVALLGIPATIWVLARIIWPEFGEDLPISRRLIVIASVVFIAVASFVLGSNQSAFLTCEDFTISGNSEPLGCTRK